MANRFVLNETSSQDQQMQRLECLLDPHIPSYGSSLHHCDRWRIIHGHSKGRWYRDRKSGFC